MQEGLAFEHSRELLRNALEELLDGGAVADKSGGHLKSPGGDVAHRDFNVVGDPLDEIAAVLVLDGQHLLVNFLHRHGAAENGGHREVSPMPWVASSHHVLGVKHLLSEFRHGERAILLTSSCGQWSEAGHEEVKARERHHVDC